MEYYLLPRTIKKSIAAVISEFTSYLSRFDYLKIIYKLYNSIKRLQCGKGSTPPQAGRVWIRQMYRTNFCKSAKKPINYILGTVVLWKAVILM